jgi:hypothetical protein
MRAYLPVVAALCVVVAGCGRSTHEDTHAFRLAEELPPGSTLHLRTTIGRIEVRPTGGSLVDVIGSKRWRGRDGDVQFVMSRSGDDVYVCAVWGRGGRCDEDGYRSTVSKHSFLRMFSLFRRSGSSDAVASFSVRLPAGVKLDAYSVNGPIKVDGARSGVIARATNGGIEILHSAGSVTAKTINGSVVVGLDSLSSSDDITAETVNGSVRAEVPTDVQGDVELVTVNGRVVTDFPLTISGRISPREVKGRIGQSSRSITLKSVNGGVQLLKGNEHQPEAESGDSASPKKLVVRRS